MCYDFVRQMTTFFKKIFALQHHENLKLVIIIFFQFPQQEICSISSAANTCNHIYKTRKEGFYIHLFFHSDKT